ncbi:MAG TPA: hypothetical protein VK211_20195, partial [Kamptonema sp.]|nr:hypothetical protein [Kamptonema sp.]
MKPEKFLNNKNYPMKSCLKPVALSLIFATAFYSIKAITTFGVPSVQAQSTPNSEALTKDWYDYTARDRSYRVKFPGQPSEEDLSVNSAIGTLKAVLVLYRDLERQRFYGTMSYKYPVNPDIYDVEKGLDGARDQAARNSNSTILREIKLSINGIPGREMTMQNTKTGETTLTRTFMNPKGPTIYLALVGS